MSIYVNFIHLTLTSVNNQSNTRYWSHGRKFSTRNKIFANFTCEYSFEQNKGLCSELV